MYTQLSTIFSKSRAEQNPDDLWDDFVLPIHYSSYNLLSFTKGNRIIGARGSGKTTYLKYHCYPTQLSKKREVITDYDLQQIGLYWKPDTIFTQQLNTNYLGTDWLAAFDTYCALSLLSEFSKLIQSLINSNYDNNDIKLKLANYSFPSDFKEVLGYSDEILNFKGLLSYCKGRKLKLSSWVSGRSDELNFKFLPGKEILEYVIEDLVDNELFANITIHVFIDEFENFTKEQQKIINTWMKHGKSPLLFSVAFKKFSSIAKETTGRENIEERDDYNKIDIVDDIYAKSDKSFDVLAAEIIILKVQEFLDKKNEYIDSETLSSPIKISQRSELEYQSYILSLIRTIFPQKPYSDIAQEIINDPTLANKLLDNINMALKRKKTSLDASSFVDKDYSAASISNSSILFRNSTDPVILLEKFNKYKKGIPDFKYKDQIDNTLVGSILNIYLSYSQRLCPVFSGFDAFTGMARNNLRHLLELCHQSFIELEVAMNHSIPKDGLPVVPTEIQAKAAKKCSSIELERMSELGPFGATLQRIAYRLGLIFQLKQKKKSQSEPEIIHFAVKAHSIKDLDPKIQKLLESAKQWNVLIEYDETKNKDITDISTKEWMLTPMVSPYFTITYRKIRKISFSIAEIETIFIKSDRDFEVFYKDLIKRWDIENKAKHKENSLFGDDL